MAASQPLPDRQECTTIAQTSFTFSPITHGQEDLLAPVGTGFVSPPQSRSSETCRTTHWTWEGCCRGEQQQWMYHQSSVQAFLLGPSSAAKWCLSLTDLPSSISSPLLCNWWHNWSKGAATMQLGVSSGSLANARAELVTHSRLWELCHCQWTSLGFQRTDQSLLSITPLSSHQADLLHRKPNCL